LKKLAREMKNASPSYLGAGVDRIGMLGLSSHTASLNLYRSTKVEHHHDV